MADSVVFGIFSIPLLYAPRSGVRNNVNRFPQKTVDHLNDLQEDMRTKVSDWVDRMSEVVSRVVRDGVDRRGSPGAEAYEQVLQGFDNARKCIEDGKSRFEQLIKNR